MGTDVVVQGVVFLFVSYFEDDFFVCTDVGVEMFLATESHAEQYLQKPILHDTWNSLVNVFSKYS